MTENPTHQAFNPEVRNLRSQTELTAVSKARFSAQPATIPFLGEGLTAVAQGAWLYEDNFTPVALFGIASWELTITKYLN